MLVKTEVIGKMLVDMTVRFYGISFKIFYKVVIEVIGGENKCKEFKVLYERESTKNNHQFILSPFRLDRHSYHVCHQVLQEACGHGSQRKLIS